MLDSWTAEDRTDYLGLRPPAEWVNANKEEAIRAAIAQPANPGQNPIELRQQTHIYDVYDYAAGDDYGNPAQQAVLVGVECEKLGVAIPFLVLGSSSVHPWFGIRCGCRPVS
ncbi:hypothetical protein [Nocardia salmonicida]|uniref:hypothetical protein n=1 Tax=Nocardia salmonicida TaxID=53431 RepID=UPI002E2C9754|nr:hypothetical protein [Nocardia salmonicida]